ncbi:MAG: F0F1 ATP synthase subunit delta [Bacillota bacterium]
MPFDWTSFVLEILNFLVLLWILKRFLYRPVLDVLDARRQAVREQVAQAEATRAQADEMKAQYESRMAAWQTEQEQARRELALALARERGAQLDALRQDLAGEKAKLQAREDALSASHEAALARKATAEAYQAAAAMLRRLASPALTAHIADLFVQDAKLLPEAQRTAVRDAASADAVVEVASAHALDEARRNRVVQALQELAARPLQPVFRERPELIAGLRVAIGQYLLQADLADELEFFRERHA